MEYSVAIRSLGKAGDMFQQELNSLMAQTIKPASINVYLAEGYPIPEETVDFEKYIYVKKGMVAQRALRYDDISSPYILFLDDDVYLPPDAVEKMFKELEDNSADVIAPCLFPTHLAPLKDKIRLSIFAKEFCRFWPSKWGYKMLRTAGASYCNNPKDGVYISQFNDGPCFLCKKEVFIKTHFEDELWLDGAPYAFPEDVTMFYKMYKLGYKLLTTYDTGIVHLDAGSTLGQNSKERIAKLIYSEYRNKLIIWKRFIYEQHNFFNKILDIIALSYMLFIQLFKIAGKYILGNKSDAKALFNGLREGFSFIRSDDYDNLNPISR